MAVTAVLVLDLDGDHRPAPAGEQGAQDWDQLVEPGVHGGQIAVVGAAQPQPGVGQQPCGEAAELPLGADVGAGSHDHVQVEPGGGAQEAGDICLSGEVGLPGSRLVQIPGDVGLDGVDAHGTQPQQPVLPQFGVDTEVVDGGGDDLVGASGAQEAALGHGQFGGGTGRCHSCSQGVGGVDRGGLVGGSALRNSRKKAERGPADVREVVPAVQREAAQLVPPPAGRWPRPERHAGRGRRRADAPPVRM